MKNLFIITIFVVVVFAVNLSAQTDVTLVGGLNLSTVKYNDNNADNYVDISMRSGFILGVETVGGPFIVGAAFIQRGANVKSKVYDFEGSDTYNYLSGYLLYPISIQKQLSVYGGCQLGKLIGGTAKFESDGATETNDLDAEDYALDFGILFGADVMFNSSVGIRGSYYIGLSNVIGVEGYPSDANYKNRGIEICLLYKFQ